MIRLVKRRYRLLLRFFVSHIRLSLCLIFITADLCGLKINLIIHI
ncbi:hypothetical protein Goklo_023140 [Gossypium klotzschianum]|uniref:Uncharacterized protein n=1 Tax=Gossypium klotzschianum TaxID=34286 RepID=A0A7J8TQ03_9ROSI|nr:hypothetical protein [Gossypium klotzschianum]